MPTSSRRLSGARSTTGTKYVGTSQSRPQDTSNGYFGPGINADTLANTNLSGNSSSSRFRAVRASPISSVRQYFITGHAGYSAGTGGTVRISVQRDDGTGKPTGTILTSESIAPGSVDPSATIGAGLFTTTFSSPYTPSGGELLHIVYDNTDANPTVNYCAHDNLFARGATISPISPKYPDWAVLMKTGGTWATRTNYTPILQVTYADGTVDGIGWMEFSPTDYGTISGPDMVGELFTPSTSLNAAGVRLRLLRVSGTDPLTVTLKTAAGATLDSFTIPAASIAVGTATNGDASHGETQVTGSFSTSQALTSGTSYRLWLSTALTSVYAIFVMRKGVDYSFDPLTFFGSTNRAQKSGDSGSTWSDAIGRVSGENDLNGFALVTG